MSETLADRKKDVICDCSGTTEQKIRALVDQGIVDLETISRKTGTCSGCGGCEPDVLDLIKEHLKQKVA